MKRFLLSAIAILAITMCTFAQVTVCTETYAPATDDFTTGVVPYSPSTFPTMIVGQPVEQNVTIMCPAEALNVAIDSIQFKNFMNVPTGLTFCVSDTMIEAEEYCVVRFEGTPTEAGDFQLKMRAHIYSSASAIFVTIANVAIDTENGYNTGITLTVVEEGSVSASFTTNPAASTDIASLDFTQAVRVYEGGSVVFTNTSMADHIAWSFEGGSPATSTENEVTVTYAAAGTYTATLTAYNQDESNSQTATATIKVSQDPSTIITASFTSDPAASGLLTQSVTIEQGQTISYTNTSTNAHHVAWSFVGGDPATSTEATEAVVVTYNTVGSFSTQLVAYSEDEQTADTATLKITVNASAENAVTADFTTDPAATDIIITSFVSINQGETITFTSACSENTHHIAWTFDGGDPATSTDEVVTVTYAEAGTFTATLTAYNEDETISNTKSLTINVASVDPNAVEADFTTDPAFTNLYITRILAIETGTTVTYTSNCNANTDHIAWTFDGGSPASSTNDIESVTYATAGSYTTTLIAYNSDESITDTVTLTVTVTDPVTDVAESSISAISVYPNPASDIFTVANAEGANIIVVNALGQVVANIENAAANQTIDASNFANGTYFVKVNAEVIKINLVK